MARYIHTSKKKRLGKLGRQTRWAPVWAVLKKFGTQKGRRTHPSRLTDRKRSWKRTKLKV